MKCLISATFAVFLQLPAPAADEGFPRVPPTEPDQAEKTFEVLHGFRMELIAAEPLVASPVDMAYDEDGRAYVVEMRDYPYPEEKNAEPTEFPGTVRLLEDADGDGRFDKATVFADQLAWPTSVACWKGGVFVAAAPDIWYFKDSDGDRRADVRRRVFTGFGRYNVQAIMNNLRWGLDNKIYGAAAGNGGNICHAERPDDKPISLARRDFCVDPASEKIEATSGGERFGNTFDDWGNRFVCNIRNPVQHVVLEQRYLARNPHFIAPNPIHDCAESGDQLRVFRLSPPEPWRVFRAQRWALEGQAMPRSELIGAGFWTSSSGVTIYRGGAYPPEFRGNVFIGEVAGNLVHRQVLTRDGVTFKSRRADENTEFVRSRDNWFRPVNFVNAPDGTLTILDMYRETIEHPWSIPDDIKAKLDLTSGKDRGRIYRLTPREFVVLKPPKLSTATAADLVAHLQSPHSWYRETAQRLLLERQDKAAVEFLRPVVRQSLNPLARLHAIYALDGLDALGEDDFWEGSSIGSPELSRHGLALGVRWAKRGSLSHQSIRGSTSGSDRACRFQAALSLGEFDDETAISGLAHLASNLDAADPWMRAAILSSAGRWPDRFALEVLRGYSDPAFVYEVAMIVAAAGDETVILRFLEGIAARSRKRRNEICTAALAGLGAGLTRRRLTLEQHISKLNGPAVEEIRRLFDQLFDTARDVALPDYERIPAIRLLGFSPGERARATLLGLLRTNESPTIASAALAVLGRFGVDRVGPLLVGRWRQLTPPLREEAVGILLSRPSWHETLVAAVESGEIPPAQVSIPHRARLMSLSDKALAERAKKALAAVALGPRKEVIEKYQSSASLKGDAEGGKLVYRRECANCHKLRGEGHDVGPNLETILHRSPQEILIHVLDPSREVSPQFLDYSVRLTDGRVLTGMIATETDGGLVLRRAENREDAVARIEIAEISSSGKSLMPEGLEQKITPQEMADLIGYLLSGR